MKFNLEVSLNIEGTGFSCGGSFGARNQHDIPGVAYQYIQSIKRQVGYRTTLIEKVMVNGTEDITNKVNEIEKGPTPNMDHICW